MNERTPTVCFRPPARPLLWLTTCFACGIALQVPVQATISLGTAFFAASVFLLLILFVFAGGRVRPGGFPIVALLFLLLGVWAAQTAAPELPFSERLTALFSRGQTPFLAYVSSPPEHYPDKVRIPLRLISALSGEVEELVETGALLTVAGKHPDQEPSFWVPGDRMIAALELRPFRSFDNPGAFDYRRHQAEKGLYASAYLKSETFLARLAPDANLSFRFDFDRAWGKIDLFRQKTLHFLRQTLDGESAAFHAALLLGYQHFLDTRWQDRIQRTGLNHLLTVSGLHLGLVSLLIFWVCRRLVRFVCPSVLNRVSDREIAVWPALASAIVYAFLAGFGMPPLWRSLLMLVACLWALRRHRPTDPLTVLALAALVLLAFDPNLLRQVSFQLTFACVLAIILVYPKLQPLRLTSRFQGLQHGLARKILGLFEDAFLMSIAVSILVLPLTIYYFKGFSFCGFAANIVLVPFVGFVLLPWGLLAIAAYAVSQSAAVLLFRAEEYPLRACLRTIEWFDGLPWGYLWTGSMPEGFLLAVYAAIALVFLPVSHRIRLSVAGVAALFLCTYAGWAVFHPRGDGLLKVDIIDVGQGTATLVRFPRGEAMIVDGGGFADQSFDIGRQVVAPFLWNQGVHTIDYMVLSHDHPDHRNGLRFLLNHFKVGSYWTSGVPDAGAGGGEPPATNLESIASARNVTVRSFPELSEDLAVGPALIRVLSPSEDSMRGGNSLATNDLSLVLEIRFGGTTVVLPGDIGSTIEKQITGKITKGSKSLLLSAHHGSRHSNSEEMLEALRPEAVVFSCGFGNTFGFPATNVLARCDARGIRTYRTDTDGAVSAVSDGQDWKIFTQAARSGRR